MTAYILQRLIQSVLVLLAVSVVVFLAVYGIGDPIELLVPPQVSAAERAAMIRRLGLDLPVWQQYFAFLGNALKGDLGRSFVHGVPAVDLILARLPATFELVLLAMSLAAVVGIPLGLLAGLNPESRPSRAIMAGTILGFSLPSFWKGMMLILLFSVLLGWLPTAGRGETVSVLGIPTSLLTLDGLRHLVLPALNLAIPNMALMIRLVAAGTAEAMTQDYVKYARAKGVRRKRIVGRHVLRNILIPVVTVAGMEFGSLVAFSTITETVFAWPGMGKLLIDSIYNLDRPVVVAYVMLATLLFVAVNFLVDILYAALDPRVKLTGDIGMTLSNPLATDMTARADTTLRKQVLRRIRSRPTTRGAVILLGILLLLALLAPFIAPQNPHDLASLSVMDNRLEPGSQGMTGVIYWLGTDAQGRDMLSAILYGLRTSLLVGLTSTAGALAIGILAGLVAAQFGGAIDAAIMRVVDFMLGFPSILIALVLLASIGRGVDKVIVAIILVQWAQYARLMRAAALVERRKEYIEAAVNFGLPTRHIMLAHLLPNSIGSVLVVSTISIAGAITLEATLSFLGVGVPVTQPSLGLLIANGFEFLLSGEYWIAAFPGIALVLLIMSLNLVGERLRRSFNVRG